MPRNLRVILVAWIGNRLNTEGHRNYLSVLMRVNFSKRGTTRSLNKVSWAMGPFAVGGELRRREILGHVNAYITRVRILGLRYVEVPAT